MKPNEYRKACPKADSDFILDCVERDLTIAQATSEYAAWLELALESKPSRNNSIGVDELHEQGTSYGIGGDRATADEMVAELMAKRPRMPREKAWQKVMKDNPELRQAIVEQATEDYERVKASRR